MVAQSHYPAALRLVKEVAQSLNGRRVVQIERMYGECFETYPCQGHDGAKLTFSDGTFVDIQIELFSIYKLNLNSILYI